jgi:hypothetical protein
MYNPYLSIDFAKNYFQIYQVRSGLLFMKLIQISLLVSLLFLFVNCTEENPVEQVNENPGPVSTGTILDSAIINQLIEKIIDGDYGEIHSLLIYKSDTLIATFLLSFLNIQMSIIRAIGKAT